MNYMPDRDKNEEDLSSLLRIFKENNKTINLPKPMGLRLLHRFRLPTPSFSNDVNDDLPNHEFYNIRTSLPFNYIEKLRSTLNPFANKEFKFPARYKVPKDNLREKRLELINEFIEKHGITPEIVIHESFKYNATGNIIIDNNSDQRILFEAWDSFQGDNSPRCSEVNKRVLRYNTKTNKLVFFPKGAYDLPFSGYTLEWIITEEDRLLFVELNNITA